MAILIGRVIAAVVTGMAVAAQTQPDFSGRWMLVVDSASGPAVPKARSVRQTLVRTNVRGEPIDPVFTDISIEREFETGIRSESRTIGIVGGTVPGRRADGTTLNGPTTHQAVKWDIDTLVFETGSYHGDRTKPSSWVDGRLRIVIATRSSDEPSRTVTLLYRRT